MQAGLSQEREKAESERQVERRQQEPARKQQALERVSNHGFPRPQAGREVFIPSPPEGRRLFRANE